MEIQFSYIDRFTLDGIAVQDGACIRTARVPNEDVEYHLQNFRDPKRSIDVYTQSTEGLDYYSESQTHVFSEYIKKFNPKNFVMLTYRVPGECIFPFDTNEVVFAPIYRLAPGSLRADRIDGWVRYSISRN
jgi:hypothetical protein